MSSSAPLITPSAAPRPVPPVDALIVVDVQCAFVSGDEAVPEAAALLGQVEDLLRRARESGALVVQLQNDGPEGTPDATGTPGWQLYFPVVAGPREIAFRKTEDDGFDGTGLGRFLSDAGAHSVAVCGVMSEMCVLATARTALARGHRVVLPHDAHATYDIPAAPGISEAVPAPMVSRVAEWALGDEIEVVPYAADVTFTSQARSLPA